MNKLLKMTFYLFLGISLYFLIPTMTANASNIGYMECNYTAIYVSELGISEPNYYDTTLIYSDYASTGSIGSDEIYDGGGLYNIHNGEIIETGFFVNPYSFTDGNYGSIGWLAYDNGYGAVDFDDRAYNSFKSAINSKNACPRYFYLIKTGNDSDEFTEPYFTNSDPECPIEAGSNKTCLALLEGTTTSISMMDEKEWVFTIECQSKKKNIKADIRLYADGNVLKYNSINDNSTDMLPTSDVTGGLVYGVGIYGIYSLEKGIAQNIGYNPKEYPGKSSYLEGVCVADSYGYISCGDTYCTATLAPRADLQCERLSQYENERSEREKKVNRQVGRYNGLAREYLTESAGDFTINNYDNSSLDVINEMHGYIKGVINDTTYEDVYTEYIEYLETLSSKICESDKDSATTFIESLKAQGERVAKIHAKLQELLSNLENQATTLGDEELATSIAETVSTAETISAAILKLNDRARKSLLDDLELRLEGLSASGCGVISANLKDFLNTILWYIRIAGVVLAIILSLLDYIKAATGSDDKSMEAANKRFMTRIILVAVLFLVPVLLDFLLTTLNISTTAGSISCLN